MRGLCDAWRHYFSALLGGQQKASANYRLSSVFLFTKDRLAKIFLEDRLGYRLLVINYVWPAVGTNDPEVSFLASAYSIHL